MKNFSGADQHLNGPDVVAAFNSDEVRYFTKK